jgi:hypothetical protein
MNTNRFSSLLAFGLLAANVTWAQNTATTTPVGYVSEVLKPNVTNIIGLTLHSPTVFNAVISSEAINKITFTGANFSTLLSSGSTYILELPDGTIQEITSWNETELFTPQDVTDQITPGVTTVALRKAPTIGEIFGNTNTFGLTPSADGGTTNCDTISIPNGSGGFSTYFYYNDGTDQLWVDVDFNEAQNVPLVYTDAMLIKRVGGSDITLTVSGEIKKTPTKVVALAGANYIGAIYPAANTLNSSSLSTQLAPSTDGGIASADLLQFPNGTGGFITNIYYNDGTDQLWVDVDFNETGASAFTSGYVLNNRNANKLLTHTPDPNVFSGL